MPARSDTQKIVCPQCGHAFTPDASVMDVLRERWMRSERPRLLKDPSIQRDVERQVQKQVRGQLGAKDEEIRQAAKDNTQLKRKITQLSRQLPRDRAQVLGTIREETLAERLVARFPGDEIAPVAKGKLGGDVVQCVSGPSGIRCGTILWECKRATAWSNTWLRKLKDDQRRGGHDAAIIVSDVHPGGGDGPLSDTDDVWIVTPELATELAVILRYALIGVAQAEQSRSRRSDLKGRVYDYLTGSAFRRRVESIIDTTARMRTTLDRERRALQSSWAQRDAEIEALSAEIAGIYGDVRGIGGEPETIEGLELPGAFESPQLPASA
jgi:hypothetical protein